MYLLISKSVSFILNSFSLQSHGLLVRVQMCLRVIAKQQFKASAAQSLEILSVTDRPRNHTNKISPGTLNPLDNSCAPKNGLMVDLPTTPFTKRPSYVPEYFTYIYCGGCVIGYFLHRTTQSPLAQ